MANTLSADEIAAKLGLSRRTLNQYRSDNVAWLRDLPMFKLCGCKKSCNHPYYVKEKDFDNWMEIRKVAYQGK